MAIDKLVVGNFKGTADSCEIEIRPLTIFFGANSSGKSSCIHALASLSQTAKLPNNTRHIILDDEYADVHLGRFIEVIHSKSYQDFITIGVDLSQVRYFDTSGRKGIAKTGRLSACYSFKCTKRTQDVSIQEAQFSLGDFNYELHKKNGSKYALTDVTNSITFPDFELARGPFIDFLEVTTQAEVNSLRYIMIHQAILKNELVNSRYLGPFRQAPKRSYPTHGANPAEVGPLGESAVTLLANEIVQTRSRQKQKQVSEWLQMMGIGKDVDVSRIAKSDLFQVNITMADGAKFPIPDLGYGISQVLPVLVQCSFCPPNSTLLFEQPELHLHSLSARQLAVVFVDTIREKNTHIIVETHSPDLIGRALRMMREGHISLDDFVLYKVTRDGGHSNFKRVAIEEQDYDIFDDWEVGVTVPQY